MPFCLLAARASFIRDARLFPPDYGSSRPSIYPRLSLSHCSDPDENPSFSFCTRLQMRTSAEPWPPKSSLEGSSRLSQQNDSPASCPLDLGIEKSMETPLLLLRLWKRRSIKTLSFSSRRPRLSTSSIHSGMDRGFKPTTRVCKLSHRGLKLWDPFVGRRRNEADEQREVSSPRRVEHELTFSLSSSIRRRHRLRRVRQASIPHVL